MHDYNIKCMNTPPSASCFYRIKPVHLIINIYSDFYGNIKFHSGCNLEFVRLGCRVFSITSFLMLCSDINLVLLPYSRHIKKLMLHAASTFALLQYFSPVLHIAPTKQNFCLHVEKNNSANMRKLENVCEVIITNLPLTINLLTH